MKSVKVKFVGLILGLICVISVIALSIMFIQNNALASASTVNNTPSDEVGETVKYFRSDSRTIVEATFNYVRLNDSECSVKIANKAEATVAIIPKKGIIDGKEYTVTEIASNGFASSPKLKRVCLSPNIKKINNSAFSNCAELEMVDLHKVETIGNNVFYKCPKLQDIRIPETVTSVGSNVFRNDNIKVHVVGDKISVDESWSSSWNNYNNCTEGVDYETKYLDPIPLDEVYAENSRSTDQEPIGYAYAAGQPVNFSNKKIQTYSDGEIDKDNIDNYKDGDDNVIIPAICEEDGKPILRIAGDAFANTPFNRCVIEYYDEPIEIVSEAFYGADGNEVIINRDVTFESSESKEKYEYIFSYSYITSIVLPDSIVCLPDSVFAGCENLTNIFFKTPDPSLSQNYLLGIAEDDNNNNNDEVKDYIKDLIKSNGAGKVDLPQNDIFKTIGANAFDTCKSILELNIYDNVKNVEKSVFDNWDNVTQFVKVYNDGPLPEYKLNADGSFIGWHDQWCGNFTHYDLAKKYYKIFFNSFDYPLDIDKNYIDVVKDEKIGKLPVPELKDYQVFKGWECEGKPITEDTYYPFDHDITVDAIIDNIEVTITFDKQGGTGGYDYVKVKYDDVMPYATAPTYVGKKFMGYYEKPIADGRKYYNADMSSDIISKFKNDTTLYAYTVELVTTIKYDLAGGVNNSQNPSSIRYSDNEVVLIPATKPGYKFVGWYCEGEEISSLYHINKEEITLTAVWKARVSDKPIAINTQLTQFVVTGDCAIALNGSFMTYCRIIISADVKNVHIYSTATRVNKYHMYIVAENRTSNLNLYLENLEIVAPNDQVAISVPTARTTRIVGIGTVGLNLYTYGTVIIRGGNGSAGVSNNWDGLDGRVAIDCDRITIFCGDDLYILGGNGGKNYLTGKHGDGGYAVDANEVRISRTEVKGIRIYGGDGINYTKSPFPSKTTVTYFD